MKCPVCGKGIKASDEFCDNCGAVLKGAVPVAIAAGTPRTASTPARGASSTATTGAVKTCSNCQTLNSPQEDYCTNCGAALNTVPVPASSRPVTTTTNGATGPATGAMGVATDCPRCGNMIAANDKFCRKCGYATTSLTNLGGTSSATAPGGVDNQHLEHKLKIGVGSKLGDRGRYEITRQIGSGGMGAVFLAEDSLLKRKVVIKALLQSDDPEMVEASIKEREFLAAVKHPNVVQIYDFLQIDTDGYIVMEFVNGKTLFSIMEERGQPFSPAEAIQHILGILPAFAYMHRLGLVYCDFKPQNIMLEEHKDGSKSVKLIDLGTVIKYEKDPLAVYGTQGFYAPEAVKHPSPETDLYTIARSLAYMVSLMDLDRPQFGMPPAEHYRVFRDSPVLYRFLIKATSPIPGKRFSTVEGMTDQLTGVLRVIAGGQAGIPVSSKLFATASLTTTGRLGTGSIASLDEKDKAYDLLKQGDTALKSGQVTQALALYNQATGVNPNSVDAHLRLAELYMERDQYTQSLAEITRVQKIDPSNWKIAWYTGRLLEAQGNLPSALDQYNELVQDLPGELPPLLAMARVHAKLGHFRESVETYTLVTKADPDNSEALFGAAFSQMSQQQFPEAATTLSKVGNGSAKFLDAQQAICDIYLYQKKQLDVNDLSQISTALRNLQDQGSESLPFLLARADFYKQTWEMSGTAQLNKPFMLPDQDPDSQVKSLPGKRQLGKLAEESYNEYLKRLPANDPNREQVVREKLKVAPWRLI